MPDFKPQRDRLTIQERATGRDVVARLVDLTPSMARRLITRTWWAPIAITKSTREVDQSWNWEERARLAHLEAHEDVFAGALVTATTERTVEVQGALTFDLNFTSFREPGVPALYLQWVATNPRNRIHLIGDQARFRNVGTVLVLTALRESLSVGYAGRVVLMAARGTEPFYERLNFRVILDSPKNRRYYEIGPDEAQGLLRKEGWI